MENKSLYKLFKNLWDNGKNFDEKYKKFLNYYDGKLQEKYFLQEDKTSENIVEEIIETKVNATLDAPFTIQVVPSISPLKDINEIKNQQIVADVLNEELHNVLKCNNFNELKEQVVRYGEIMGFSAIQTVIEKVDDRSEIKLKYISPEDIRFDKSAKSVKELSFVAYKKCVPPQVVKEKYCKNPDGSYNYEKCALIDQITTDVINQDNNNSNKSIISYKTETSAGLAYNTSVGGMQAGKVVELVEMFVIDTSAYSPNKEDNEQTQKIKEDSIFKYPNGRLVVFSLKGTLETDNSGLILSDTPAPKGFRNIANIDIFNPLTFNNIEGKSEVEDLIPIQNRINGTLAKMAFLVSQNVNAIIAPDGIMDIGDDEVVAQTVLKVNKLNPDGSNPLFTLKNGMIEEATKLEALLQRYEKAAYTKAHLNETLINGARQAGTTSGEQVEQLNESPMSYIRLIQKNLKNFIIEIGNKIITLIQEYYNEDRIISIATGLTVENLPIKYAKFGIDTITNEQFVQLLTEALKVAKTIKLNKDWKYTIEVVAGVEIPRSRKELAYTMEKIFVSGMLNVNADVDLTEQYLKSLDIPNYRAIIQLLRQKQQQVQEQQSQAQLNIQTVLVDPNLSKNFAEIFKGLDGFSNAKGQILKLLGLDTSTDTFTSAPVQSITSKSSATDIATIIPSKVSENPQQQAKGEENAVADKLLKRGNL